MCGNSLLDTFEGVKLFDESLLGWENKLDKDTGAEIKKLNLKFGRIETGEEKGDIKQLKKEIKKLEKKKDKLRPKKEDGGRNLTLGEIGKITIQESKKSLLRFKALQKNFFCESDGNKKKLLKKDIDQLEWELIEVTLKEQGNDEALDKLKKIKKGKSKPFFLWKLYFAEIFRRENPGFDVVISNPTLCPGATFNSFGD